MSPRARRLAALAAAVAGGLAVPLLAGACSVSVGPLQHRTSSYSVAGPLSALVVRAHVGTVQVTGRAPGSKVTVTERLTFRKTAPVTTHRTAAHVLTLGSSCPSLETCGVSYDIAVPSTMAVRATTSVSASTSAGLILLRVPGNVGYAVDASTTVGKIQIGVQRSAASPHVITATATTGSITIEPAR
jgi:hypothetical protein